MSVHELPSPDPTPWGARPHGAEGEFEALLLAWSEALKHEAQATELLDHVRRLQSDLQARERELALLRQASYVLSALDRIEPMATLARDLLSAHLFSEAGVIWVLGERNFEAKASLGVDRAMSSLELPAPNPFPGLPIFLGHAQGLLASELPEELSAVHDALGPQTFFVPFEHLHFLVGFGLFRVHQDPPIDETALGTLELMQRAFAAAMHQAWSLRDLQHRRDLLKHSAEEDQQRLEVLRRENVALTQGQGYRMEFLGFALDQLRPILAQAMGTLNRLKQDPDLRAEEQSSLLMESLLHGKRMAEFLRDLTELARPGRSAVQVQGPALPIDLAELLDEVHSIVDAMPRQDGAEIDWPDVQDLPEIMATRDTLRQVLLSLCHGAIQRSRNGSIHLWIEREPMHLAIRLLLEGLDIEPADRALHRTGSIQPSELYAKGKGSSGLGLVITDHLVKSMGGTLRLDRDFFGQGTVVSLDFPVA